MRAPSSHEVFSIIGHASSLDGEAVTDLVLMLCVIGILLPSPSLTGYLRWLAGGCTQRLLGVPLKHLKEEATCS